MKIPPPKGTKRYISSLEKAVKGEKYNHGQLFDCLRAFHLLGEAWNQVNTQILATTKNGNQCSTFL
jgi:hypothetical protein